MRVAARAKVAKAVSLLIGGRYVSGCRNHRAIQRDMQAVSVFGCFYQTLGAFLGDSKQQKGLGDQGGDGRPRKNV